MSSLSLDAMVVLALGGAAVAQATPIVLTDVTKQVGLDWVQVENNTMMGAGGAFLDYDGDGWLDILLAGGVATPGLYRNVGGGKAFVAVTPSPFPNDSEYMCTTVADIDNDGDPDVFFGRFGPNLLFRNDGGGKFTDITPPAIAGAKYGFTTTAAFGDYDNDGNLDLYIGNYIAPGSQPPYHTPTPNQLFHGNGDGTFTDVTDPNVAGAGVALATGWSDYDHDGDQDLFVENDFGAYVQPNRLYRNDGNGPAGQVFTECSVPAGANLAIFCMGIAGGDIDHDGDFDYYFTNLGRNVLLRNDGGTFTDITTAAGVELTYDPDTSPPIFATSWGCGFFDFDNDGWLDLYVSNGWIPSGSGIANGRNTRDTLYHCDGSAAKFSEVNVKLDAGIGRGAAFGDYDDDGDIDVLQINVNGAPVLMRNDTPRVGHWFAARLRGRISNRDALGARVDADLGSFVACREVRRNDSFESSSQPRVQMGLGGVTRIRHLQVAWPSGIHQDLHDVGVDRAIPLVEPLVLASQGTVKTTGRGSSRSLVARVALDNASSAVVTGWCVPQIRVGDGAASPLGAPGTPVWTGSVRPVSLPANGAATVEEELPLPISLDALSSLGLNLVWIAVDTGLGVDENSVQLR